MTRRKKIIFILLSGYLTLLNGCSLFPGKNPVNSDLPATTKNASPAVITDRERRFAGALDFLRKGSEQAARESLELVIEDTPQAGITDEALFRLSILQLREETGKGVVKAQMLLERLKTEFPRSPWTFQAAPLSTYLAGVRALRDRQRELKTLKELNLSLSRDNRDLKQSIERLRNLDIELEQKIRH